LLKWKPPGLEEPEADPALDAEAVTALEAGTQIRLVGEDADGNERSVICTVAYMGAPCNKFLTYRTDGKLHRLAIRDYPGKRYERTTGATLKGGEQE
jgi:hypothetical protein